MQSYVRAILLAAGLVMSSGALAQSYPYELGANDPQSLAALQKILPGRLKSVEWVYRLHGTATPLERKVVAGTTYLAGWVCKPHDCGSNQFAFLISANRARVVALLRIAEEGGDVTFGMPTTAEFEALQLMMN